MSPMHTPQKTRGLTIAHPTALDSEEQSACAHAVALALRSQSTLLSLHVNDDEASRERMARACDLLARWKLLPQGASEGDEEKLGMHHKRLLDSCCDDPVDTLLAALTRAEPDLIVAATSAREGVQRLFFGSVAEALALHATAPNLLIPLGARPFVSAETGELRLGRILVPVGDPESGQVGAQHAAWLADVAGAHALEVELLHVSDGSTAPPDLPLPERPGTRFHVHSMKGPVEETIVQRAEASGCDLIVMATRGHDSVRDVLTGSHTERVLHRALCPVLSVRLPTTTA